MAGSQLDPAAWKCKLHECSQKWAISGPLERDRYAASALLNKLERGCSPWCFSIQTCAVHERWRWSAQRCCCWPTPTQCRLLYLEASVFGYLCQFQVKRGVGPAGWGPLFTRWSSWFGQDWPGRHWRGCRWDLGQICWTGARLTWGLEPTSGCSRPSTVCLSEQGFCVSSLSAEKMAKVTKFVQSMGDHVSAGDLSCFSIKAMVIVAFLLNATWFNWNLRGPSITLTQALSRYEKTMMWLPWHSS